MSDLLLDAFDFVEEVLIFFGHFPSIGGGGFGPFLVLDGFVDAFGLGMIQIFLFDFGGVFEDFVGDVAGSRYFVGAFPLG